MGLTDIVNIISKMSLLQYKMYNMEQTLSNGGSPKSADPHIAPLVNALPVSVPPELSEESGKSIPCPQR